MEDNDKYIMLLFVFDSILTVEKLCFLNLSFESIFDVLQYRY